MTRKTPYIKAGHYNRLLVGFVWRAWRNKLALFIILSTIISGCATYAALKEMPPFGNDPQAVFWLLNIDLVLLMLFMMLIARRIVGVWSGRKRGLAGSHLHVRLVYTFSILAAAPAIIMTIFAAFFFHFGVQTWFSERVRTAIVESQAVAQAYLEEHTQVIRADTLAMANDLNRQAGMLLLNEPAFDRIIQTQSILRNLSEAIVFNSNGRVLARSGLTFSLEFEEIPPYAMQGANEGDVIVMTGSNDDRVRALIKLDNFIDTYLFVGRMIDPQVLSHLDATKAATQDYARLEERYSALQITVTMIFVVVGLLLLMSAIWLGLLLARQIVSPISTLIMTADRVRAGDLSARVPEQKALQEFEYLAQSFNRMTRQIQEQQNELLFANRQLDRRRHFTETVLSGVSSGVVGLDKNGFVNITNSSALKLFDKTREQFIGHELTQLFPEMQDLYDEASIKPQKINQAEIPFTISGHRKILLVRMAMEHTPDQETSAVLTFDDITELQSAQRKAAWSDVARRIAHEIKNPLTPIQLSAERLQRRYMSQITQDQDIFKQCTETIVRHVDDIGRMVNEFSSFARMPEPEFSLCDAAVEIQQALNLYIQAHSDINFDLKGFDTPHYCQMDSGQIRQAITNLLQNAVDALSAGNSEAKDIQLRLGTHEAQIYLAIRDSGPGYPPDQSRASLTEPYVTHKVKGTGLGLAIVKKIMEDHGGRIILDTPEWLDFPDQDAEKYTGATAVLIWPGMVSHKEKRSKEG